MLTKMRSLNYAFDENADITKVTVAFHNYHGDLTGNLNIVLTAEDGDLNTLSPNQLQDLAKDKIIGELTVTEEV